MTSRILVFLVGALNVLASHALLTRKKTSNYCIGAFCLTTLFSFSIGYIISQYTKNLIVMKYLPFFLGFIYLFYICIVFKESIEKKIFTMMSIWLFSIMGLYISVLICSLLFNVISAKYIQMLIGIVKILNQILVLIVCYFYASKTYKGVLNMVSDKTIRFMSIYPVIAFVLLMKNYSANMIQIKDFGLVSNIILFLIFIVMGYMLVFAGISSASQVIALQYDLKSIENQAKLHYQMANFDSLTEVANRANIINQLTKVIEVSNQSEEQFALMLFDIDKFKKINDDYGHLIGDRALKYVAQTVQNILKSTDAIGRFGGDEFLIIHRVTTDERDEQILIDRIFEELKKPFVIGDNKILISISVGIRIFSEYTSDLESLIYEADHAMYEAKRIEGCSAKFFVESDK